MSKLTLAITALLAVLLIATGCGQKGALYLPDDPSQMEVIEQPAAEGSSPVSDDDNEPNGDDEDEDDEEAEPAPTNTPRGEGSPP